MGWMRGARPATTLAMALVMRLGMGLGIGLGLAACSPSGGDGAGSTGQASAAAPATKFHGLDITGANYAQELTVPDLDGKMRPLSSFAGKVVVVFFGYTQCPDVCPTTMGELVAAKQKLGADGDKVQGVFVTVDPERDTAEILREYVKAFDPSFVALRGTHEQTLAMAKAFKVYYAKAAPAASAGSYTVDHTAASFVFDPKGRIRLYERYGAGPQVLADDIRILLGGA